MHSEADLRQELYARVFRTERLPEIAVDPAHRWRIVSALQKSIRRGHVPQAVLFATQVHALDPAYLWRRLCIIALEDIGFGDVLACALAIEANRSSRFRQQLGELKVLAAVVTALASAAKSRSITDALVVRGTPTHTIKPAAFQAQIESYEAPWLIKYLATRGFSYADLGKFVPAVYGEWRRAMVTEQHHDPDIAGDELIEGIPAAAFDMYTAEGKRVASYLSKCQPFRLVTPAQISMLLFHIEGSYMNRSITSVELTALDLDAKLVDWRSVGLGPRDAGELKNVLSEHRALVNHARRRIMG
jgi:hypothetical protein